MKPFIAIAAAFPAEIKPLIKRLEGPITHQLESFSFLQGQIANKRVLLAISGVGRSNSYNMTKVLVKNFPLSLIISTGTAGALQPHLQSGDIVVADQLFISKSDDIRNCNAHDLAKKAVSAYQVEKALIQLSLKTLEATQLRYKIGSIITVDMAITQLSEKCTLGNNLNCLAVEMESAAIAKVAEDEGLPFLAIRSISDSMQHNIDKAIQLYEHLKDKRSIAKRLFYMLKSPQGSLQLLKLRNNSLKAAASLEKFFLHFLSNAQVN
jgi:adenosylhomocysteine nucleosidase